MNATEQLAAIDKGPKRKRFVIESRSDLCSDMDTRDGVRRTFGVPEGKTAEVGRLYARRMVARKVAKLSDGKPDWPAKKAEPAPPPAKDEPATARKVRKSLGDAAKKKGVTPNA